MKYFKAFLVPDNLPNVLLSCTCSQYNDPCCVAGLAFTILCLINSFGNLIVNDCVPSFYHLQVAGDGTWLVSKFAVAVGKLRYFHSGRRWKVGVFTVWIHEFYIISSLSHWKNQFYFISVFWDSVFLVYGLDSLMDFPYGLWFWCLLWTLGRQSVGSVKVL